MEIFVESCIIYLPKYPYFLYFCSVIILFQVREIIIIGKWMAIADDSIQKQVSNKRREVLSISKEIKIFLQYSIVLKYSMNFEANHLPSFKIVSPSTTQSGSILRLKTWAGDMVDDEHNNKRFKRSQSKTFKYAFNGYNTSQNLQNGSFRTKKAEDQQRSQKNSLSKNNSQTRQAYQEAAYFPKQKFRTQPLRQQKSRQNVSNYAKQQIQHCVTVPSIKKKHFDEPALVQNYPFRFISTNFNYVNCQSSQSIEKPAQQINQNNVKAATFRRNVSLNLENTSDTLTCRTKQDNENFNKTVLSKINFSQVSSNLPTQATIRQLKISKKSTFGSQTQTTKMNHTAINTVLSKTNTLKVQTDQTNSSIQKLVDGLKQKIQNLQAQNKKLKQTLLIQSKSREQTIKSARQLSTAKQRERTKSTCLDSQPQKQALPNLQSIKQQQTPKQLSLHLLISSLKSQIQQLKQSHQLQKFQQILSSLKKQNQSLSSQLKTQCLKSRMLEQQNSQLMNSDQQIRKLKLQIKYLKAAMKDYKQQLERVKSQYQKLRQKPNQNRIVDDSGFKNWGSETDSLCLSVSFTRD